jgi:hypothetical protein
MTVIVEFGSSTRVRDLTLRKITRSRQGWIGSRQTKSKTLGLREMGNVGCEEEEEDVWDKNRTGRRSRGKRPAVRRRKRFVKIQMESCSR